MYPLLVNAIAATASNLIDRWAQSHAAKAAAAPVPFQQVLDGASTQRSAAVSIERLRGELLSSPELRTAIDSADPSRPVTIQLSSDGTLSAQSPGSSPQLLSVSPETAAAARTLASLLSPSNGAGSFSLNPAR